MTNTNRRANSYLLQVGSLPFLNTYQSIIAIINVTEYIIVNACLTFSKTHCFRAQNCTAASLVFSHEDTLHSNTNILEVIATNLDSVRKRSRSIRLFVGTKQVHVTIPNDS